MMRQSLCAFFLVLGIVLQVVVAQPSSSNTNTNSLTGTVTVTGSNSVSVTTTGSNSVTGSISATVTKTVSGTTSGTPSWTNTHTASFTVSLSGTPTSTLIPPPAPVNVQNLCLHHIINICPSWSAPPGIIFTSYLVTFSTGGVVVGSFRTSRTSGRVTNLTPNTAYAFTVQGFEASGLGSLVSAPVTFTTDPADAKIVPSEDIHNITCVSAKNPATGRAVINCNWQAASPISPTRLSIKWRCVSAIRLPDTNHKKLFGAAAAATSVTLKINRDVATCTIYFKAYYPRRPATRHVLTVLSAQ